MIFTFDKSILLVVVLVFLKGVHCDDHEIIFSQEYYTLLQYSNANKTQLPKCQLINTSPASAKVIFDNTLFNKTFDSLKNTKPAIGISKNGQQHNNLTTFSVIFEEVSSLIEQIWTDIEEEYIQSNQTQKLIEYKQNFASLDGGAMILRISSNKIKSAQALLDDNNDKYMYTNEQLPIEIVIALKQEVSIEKIVIKSNEYYSSTINYFIAYGAFSLGNDPKADQNWFKLVEVNAKNQAGQQHFRTVNKVIRFIKIRVISAYGMWKYFTMTQIKIHGNSLYAQAMNNYHLHNNEVKLEPQVDISSIHLYEDLEKMIALAREGNKTIPENNLIKYFFQELRKLAILEQKQILYMNNLTQKLQALSPKKDQNDSVLEKVNTSSQKEIIDKLKVSMIYNYFKPYTLPQNLMEEKKSSEQNGTGVNLLIDGQVKKIKQDIDNFYKKLEASSIPQEQISQTTLIIICIASSFLLTTAAFLLAFFIMTRQSKVSRATTTATSTSPTSSSQTNHTHRRFSNLREEDELGPLMNRPPEKQKQGKNARKYRGKQSKR